MTSTQIKAEDLPPDLLEQLNKDRVTCAELVTLILNRQATSPPSIQQLHNAFDLWIEYHSRKQKRFKLLSKKDPPIPPEAIALTFGAVLGEHIIAATRLLEWKLVTDSYGTSVALFASGIEGKYTDIITDPQGMMMKRIQSKQLGCIEPTFSDLVDQILEWTT